jgi:hypothetical protein
MLLLSCRWAKNARELARPVLRTLRHPLAAAVLARGGRHSSHSSRHSNGHTGPCGGSHSGSHLLGLRASVAQPQSFADIANRVFSFDRYIVIWDAK